MKDLLSQDEIDALLHGVDSGAVETDPEPPSGEARSYDFASQDRIIRGRMPTLEMVHERFARLWRIGLFNLIRRSAELSVRGIELIKFNDYMHSLYVPTNLNLIRFKPLRGTGLIVFEPTLVFAIVDNFFGGDGRYPTRIEGREFTATEMRVIHLLLKQTFADLREAWAPVMDVDFEYINSEINPHFANIVTPREYVVVCRLHVELDGDTRFEVMLVLQHVTVMHNAENGVRLGCEWGPIGGAAQRARSSRRAGSTASTRSRTTRTRCRCRPA